MLLNGGGLERVVPMPGSPRKMSLQGGGVAGQAHRRSQAAAELGNVRTCWEGYEKVVTSLGQGFKVTERLHIQGP